MKQIIENSSDLLLFTYLVEHKSFTALANQLDMNKSVVSKRIKNLENQLKTQLLIRNTRSLELTEAGRLLYERTHKLHNDFHSISRLRANQVITQKLARLKLGNGQQTWVFRKCLISFNGT